MSFTGLTEPFSNVDTIIYNPPSGSSLSAGTTIVASTVNYKWGVSAVEAFFVQVVPGFASADIVRVSWNGQPVPVFY